MPVVLDLSAAAAGQSSVTLRFRFESGFLGSDGIVWQVDDVQLEALGAGPPPTAAPPGQAATPSPASGSNDQDLNTTLSWTAGADAASHDVYFGTATPLGGGDFRGNQAGTSFDPGTLNPGTTYYWRVDEVNAEGTTQGLTWNFTTAAAPTVAVSVAGLSGSVIPGSRGRWTAVVDVAVNNQDGDPETGVTVEGNWSNGSSGSGSCMTNEAGRCAVNKANLKSNVASVSFTVTDLVKPGAVYAPAGNAAGDSIVVSQAGGDLTPSATNDSFQTEVNMPVSGNLMANDDPGDAPAVINSHSSPTNGNLSLNPDGSFTYTPAQDFEGSDSFTYDIIDQDLDVSNSATVSVAVTAVVPPSPGGLSVTATPTKVKGIQHVIVSWDNSNTDGVTISRDGQPIPGPFPGYSGSYDDNREIKGGGQIYSYTVCETGPAPDCVTASAAF